MVISAIVLLYLVRGVR